MVSAGAKKTCYYELLGLDRKCEAAEIKATYRKLALRMHPDKAHQNGMCPEEATKRFQQIQEAYSVLSDAQERAWYDAHREQILRGDDGPGEDPFKTKINLYKYFSVSCFDGFGNDARGFYAVYAELFEAIDAEEEQWEDADEDHLAMPPFGRSDTEWADVSAFYRHWLDFCSRKAFGHADQWNPKDATNRQVRRAMEQENKKARQAAKKEFNAEVRQLVKFVQKRDPRYQARQKQQMKENMEKSQRERAEKDRRKADEAKEKEERKAAARQAEEERWAEAKARKEEQRARGEVVSEDDEEDSEEEQVEYFCEPCRKSFKSEKAFDQHAKSKKHLQVVAKLRKELDQELEEEARASKASKEEATEVPHDQGEPMPAEERREEPAELAPAKLPDETRDMDSETREDDANSESGSDSEDNFLARFAAQKQGSRGGYPQPSKESESDKAEDSPDEQQEDIRGRRAQKKEQQMAAALQKLQEREAEAEVGGGKPRKKEVAELSAKDGPIPEGNVCGVCGEDFGSRSAMFKHIKATGHAMLKPLVAEEPAKGKKKRR